METIQREIYGRVGYRVPTGEPVLLSVTHCEGLTDCVADFDPMRMLSECACWPGQRAMLLAAGDMVWGYSYRARGPQYPHNLPVDYKASWEQGRRVLSWPTPYGDS